MQDLDYGKTLGGETSINNINMFSPKIHEGKVKIGDGETVMCEIGELKLKLKPTCYIILTVKLFHTRPYSVAVR